MSQNQSPLENHLTLTVSPENLQGIINQIEKSVIQRIKDNPNDFFPEKPSPLKLYSTEEVARLLRLSEATIRNLCNAGKLKHLRPSGRNIMVSQEQLDQYLESLKTATYAE